MRLILSLLSLLMTLGISAQGQDLRPMLVDGKSWVYVYHYFEECETEEDETSEDKIYEEFTYDVTYTLEGDTIINGVTYAKLMRHVDGNSTYSIALREDGATVYCVRANESEESVLITFDPAKIAERYLFGNCNERIESINVNGREFIRHRYEPDEEFWDFDPHYIGVEGVGFSDAGLLGMNLILPKCLCDYESFKACYNKNWVCIFKNEDFYKEAVAQEPDDEYIPFVEEGKVWICRDDYGIYGSLAGYDVIFTMTGDMEINGKTYKKVYLQFPGYFGDEEQHYHCAVREEDCRVFVVEPETEEENLLYDFSRPEEILELSYDDRTFARNAGYQDEYSLPHQMFYRLYRNVDAINKGYGGIGDWREGVGAIHVDPFARQFSVTESSKIPTAILVQECMNSAGEYLWKLHAKPNSIQETLKKTPAGSTLYDLQGRRLSGQPTKGIYIQNGKKVVVK